MGVNIFTGNSADEAWLHALAYFRSDLPASLQSSRCGLTRELLHAVFTISEPRQRWVLSRNPPLNPAFASAEVVWLLTGRADSAFLRFWNSRLAHYAGATSEYHGAYGSRLRSHFRVDQLERDFRALANDTSSRQIVLQLWDPQTDLPSDRGLPASEDVPCNVCALLKLRHDRLEWMQVTRSNDMALGVPYNFVQFTTLQEVMAGWLGVELGDYNHLSDSLHIYESDQDALFRSTAETPQRNVDDLALPKKESDCVFRELTHNIDRLAAADLSEHQLSDACDRFELPLGYYNLALVMAAESARRRKWHVCANEIAHRCQNSLLRSLWLRWAARCSGAQYEVVLEHGRGVGPD